MLTVIFSVTSVVVSDVMAVSVVLVRVRWEYLCGSEIGALILTPFEKCGIIIVRQ